MSKKFDAQVDDFVKETKKRLTALAREANQRLIDDAQTPTAKGGRMRVDTGFLRLSGQLSFSGMPSGPIRPAVGQKYEWDSSTVTASLGTLEIGATLYFGWTANYAKYREGYDGFLGGAVQNWQMIVTQVCAEIRARSPNG